MDTPQIRNPVSSKEEEEEGKSEMMVVRCSNSSSSSSSTRKVLKADDIHFNLDSFPDEILNDILIRIPAQDILDATMLVSRKWYQMTHTRGFIFAHLHHSTHGLLTRNLNNHDAHFLSITPSGKIQISKFRYKFRRHVWSSCNGLVLEHNVSDDHELIVTNPLTNQHFDIPPFMVRTPLHPTCISTLTYVASQLEYKVLRTFTPGLPSPHPHSQFYPYNCAILTVGVDTSWRLVDTQHLSLKASQLLIKCPLVTEGGFVHWAEDWQSNWVMETSQIITQMSNQFVLTMNTETETIAHIAAPRCNGGYYYYKYLSGRTCLSLLIGRGYLKWEVWEMKPETGEWTKLPDIDLEAHKGLLNDSYDVEEMARKPGPGDCLDCKLLPAAWLKYPDVIVFVTYKPIWGGSFGQVRSRVVYYVQTQKISLFAMGYHCQAYIDHRNSFVSMLD